MLRLMLTIAALAMALCFEIPPGHAQNYGDAQWCAVLSETDAEVVWECYYRSIEECRPNVIGAIRGLCNVNPYWTGSPAPKTVASSTHRKHHVRRH